jgi:TrmH family RNA methyltransferase
MTKNQPHTVLVRPIYPRNIGSCSRALANTGAGELILVSPQCEINLEARQGAAGAQQRLFEAKTHKSLKEFLENSPHGLKFAFSGKPGARKDKMSFAERLHWIEEKRPEALEQAIYFIFGPEDDGLLSEELNACNYVHDLPIDGDFKSMNLSHAVLLANFIFKSTFSTALSTIQTQPTPSIDAALGDWLAILGFETKDRKRSALTVLRRTIMENAPSPEDLNVLSAIVQQTIRKLKG